MNIFPRTQLSKNKPLGIDLMIRASTIHHSNVYDYRAGINLVYRFLGLRIGYRYIDFEGNNDIRGPEAGIRCWF